MRKNKSLHSKTPPARPAALERRQPGVIILSYTGKLLYLNAIAEDLLNTIQREPASSAGNGAAAPSNFNKRERRSLHLIRRLHHYFQKINASGAGSARDGMPALHPVFRKRDTICFARAFRLQSRPETPESASLLILIEVSERQEETPRSGGLIRA